MSVRACCPPVCNLDHEPANPSPVCKQSSKWAAPSWRMKVRSPSFQIPRTQSRNIINIVEMNAYLDIRLIGCEKELWACGKVPAKAPWYTSKIISRFQLEEADVRTDLQQTHCAVAGLPAGKTHEVRHMGIRPAIDMRFVGFWLSSAVATGCIVSSSAGLLGAVHKSVNCTKGFATTQLGVSVSPLWAPASRTCPSRPAPTK